MAGRAGPPLAHPSPAAHSRRELGHSWGDEPADDEFTRIGLSALGRLALDASAGACGPVPLGLALGDLHPRRGRAGEVRLAVDDDAPPPLRPGFGVTAVLDALHAARGGAGSPSSHLHVPASPSSAVVDVDLSSLLAGRPAAVRLTCRFESIPAPAVPPEPLAPPPELVAQAQAQGLTSFAWVSYGPHHYAGPTLVITGTPTGVDVEMLMEQLRDAAFHGSATGPRVAGIDDESIDRIGTRLLVHTDEPGADLSALRSLVSGLPAATDEVTWHLAPDADTQLRGWASRIDADDSGLRRLIALAG